MDSNKATLEGTLSSQLEFFIIDTGFLRIIGLPLDSYIIKYIVSYLNVFRLFSGETAEKF